VEVRAGNRQRPAIAFELLVAAALCAGAVHVLNGDRVHVPMRGRRHVSRWNAVVDDTMIAFQDGHGRSGFVVDPARLVGRQGRPVKVPVAEMTGLNEREGSRT
jgi:hypothetical protein